MSSLDRATVCKGNGIAPGRGSYPWDFLIWKTTHTEPSEQLDRISSGDLLHEQHSDAFCIAIRSRLNGGEVMAFKLNEGGVLRRTDEAGNQIMLSQGLKGRVLHLGH